MTHATIMNLLMRRMIEKKIHELHQRIAFLEKKFETMKSKYEQKKIKSIFNKTKYW